jgi:hypothetical protein
MATRRTPTVGPDPGSDYANKVNTEIAALWNGVWNQLGTIGGTGDAITAVCSSATLDAYAAGQGFYFYPTATNTATDPKINIDGRGQKIIKDQDGLTVLPGKLVVSRLTRLVYDGTFMRISDSAGGPVRFFLSFAGALTSNELLVRLVMTDILFLPAAFSGSLAKAGTAALAQVVLKVMKNAPASADATLADVSITLAGSH